jgi:hypothetical protein
VQPISDCELTFLGRAAFTEMLDQHPELYIDVVTTLAACLRQADEDMVASRFLTMRARGRALLQFARQLGEEAGPEQLSSERIAKPSDDVAAHDAVGSFRTSERQEHTLQPSGGAMKALTCVNVFDLNNSCAPPAHSTDGMHAEPAVGD